MPKPEKDIVLVTVPNKLMSALRAYWTTKDLDQVIPMSTNFWDLRYGMVNRWQSEDVRSPHIRYGLRFRRTDSIDDAEYAQKHGSFPPAPESWDIIFAPGTFPEHWNPGYDEWINANMPAIARIENRKGLKAGWAYVKKYGPPEQLPNPDNWTPEQAAAELQEIMPKAIELFEGERLPIDWKPKGFIV